MKNKVLIGSLLTLLGNSSLSYAKDKEQKCDKDIILSIADELRLNGIDESDSKNPWLVAGLEGVRSAVCKTNPQDKNLMYVALASNPNENKDGQTYYDFTVAILDLTTEKVVASYKDKIEEDASFKLGRSYLWIDTANYRLNDKVLAFGIDIKSDYAANCADGGSGGTRTLYVAEGKKIKPILKNINIKDWRYLVQGKSKCNSKVEDSVISITKEKFTSISIADTVTNGFKDIIINVDIKITDENGKRISKDNKVVTENLYKDEPLKSYSYKLSYDGNKYPFKNR